MNILDNNWSNKISNVTQLGGIQTSVLDNGQGRGVRIAWINTGGGLRFKVVLDRAMDIAEASFNQYNLSWISHLGVNRPQPFSDRDADWLRTFGGGLLVTCGLTHVGGPEEDHQGRRGLHDQISNTPAEIMQIKQPNIAAGDREMFITGVMKQGHPLGVQLELKRTIRCYLGESKIIIEDEVINVGNIDAPHMLLYHFNLGWPLVDAGAKLLWKGDWVAREEGEANKIFKADYPFKLCQEPREDHRGGGEEAAFINIEADSEGNCTCGIYNEKIGLALTLSFKKKQLPWLTNWQHWGIGEYVVGLEPGTNPPMGQKKTRENGELILLKPQERRTYDLTLDVLNNKHLITEFIDRSNS